METPPASPKLLPSNSTTSTHTSTRITIHSDTAYATVLERFRTLVPVMKMPLDRTSHSHFEAHVSNGVGDYGFAIFHEINHGHWIPLFSTKVDPKGPNGGRELRRFILGNPLIAITLIREDLEAGLMVPVEVLFIEEEHSTRCTFELPSGLAMGSSGGQPNPGLLKAAERLDRKFLKLMNDVMA